MRYRIRVGNYVLLLLDLCNEIFDDYENACHSDQTTEYLFEMVDESLKAIVQSSFIWRIKSS